MLMKSIPYLQFAPLWEEDNVVHGFSAHVEQRLATFTDSNGVGAFRISTWQSFAETDVKKPELDPLACYNKNGFYVIRWKNK